MCLSLAVQLETELGADSTEDFVLGFDFTSGRPRRFQSLFQLCFSFNTQTELQRTDII